MYISSCRAYSSFFIHCSFKIKTTLRFYAVYSKDVKWEPVGNQNHLYSDGEERFGMIEKDILLCKMRPNQEISAYMHAVKGIGKDHAKFSPVGKIFNFRYIFFCR